jgi:hypothetical protein
VDRLICTKAALSQTILTLPGDFQQTGYLMTLSDRVNGGAQRLFIFDLAFASSGCRQLATCAKATNHWSAPHHPP